MAVNVKFAGAISGSAAASARQISVGRAVGAEQVCSSQLPVARRSRRGWRSSVKFAGAISGIAVARTSVGSGVTLGSSVSVAAVLGVAVAAISVGLAVGDGPAAVTCPALVDRGADGGQRQIRRRDFWPRRRGDIGWTYRRRRVCSSQLPALVERGADGGQRQIRRRDFWTRRREDIRRKRRLARQLSLCLDCARCRRRYDICRTCRRRQVCNSQLPALIHRGADGGQCQIRWRDFWFRRRKVFRRKRRNARQLCLCRGCAWRLLSLRYLSDLPSATGLQQSLPGALRSWRGWRSVSNSPARFLDPPSRGLPSEAA